MKTLPEPTVCRLRVPLIQLRSAHLRGRSLPVALSFITRSMLFDLFDREFQLVNIWSLSSTICSEVLPFLDFAQQFISTNRESLEVAKYTGARLSFAEPIVIANAVPVGSPAGIKDAVDEGVIGHGRLRQ